MWVGPVSIMTTLFLLLAIMGFSAAHDHDTYSYLAPGTDTRVNRLLRSDSQLTQPDDETRILLAFRSGITKDPTGALNDWSWNNRSKFCTWNGVGCDSQHVTSLQLQGLGLGGTISAQLGGLAFLKILNLGDNLFTGPIPLELANCSALTNLFLSNNSINGSIPASLGDAKNLGLLDLSVNRLTGPIPPELGNCSGLTNLLLLKNYINGDIPASLGDLRSLEVLQLDYNQLSGEIPVEVLILPQLHYLLLSENKLTGSLSHTAMLNLSVNFEEFSVGRNELSGTIPKSSLDNSTNLSYLNMSRNLFSGELPPSYGRAPHITVLDVSHNSLRGPVPLFCNGSKLEESFETLFFDHNLFTGAFPPELTNCHWMANLRLSHNHFDGMLPDFAFPFQLVVDFSNNFFSGEIPVSLTSSHELQVLRLSNNFLSGQLMLNLTNKLLFQSLSVSDNMLTGEIPIALGNCTALQLLDLSSNLFTGSIPDFSYDLPSLRVLKLGSNDLQGGIPTWILGLKQLQILDLSNNMLEGNIPRNLTGLLGITVDNPNSTAPTDNSTLQEEIIVNINGNARNLLYILRTETIIDLSSNSFTGEIPREVGDLKALKYLKCSNNKLNGTIDERLGLIRGLLSMDLSRNELSGPIPSFLSISDAMGYLNLSYNNLSGNIPTTRFPASAYLPGNDYLCSPTVINRSCPTQSPMPIDSLAYDGTDFTDMVSILAVQVGAMLGFLSMGTLLLLSRSFRRFLFWVVPLPNRNYDRLYDRVYGLFQN